MSKVYTINTGNKAQFLSEYALLSGSRITGSLFGTASWAQSSSVANSASFAPIGPGTVNSIALFNASNTVSSSVIFQSGTSIGIGTSSPATTVDVAASNAILRVTGLAGTVPQLQLSSTGNVNWSLRAHAGAGSEFTIYQDSTERLRITPSGNVGIGTINPTVALQVSRTDSGIIVNAGGSAVTGSGIKFRNDGYEHWTAGVVGTAFSIATSGDNGDRIWGNTPTRRLTITSTGLVGVGTTSPDANFTVEGQSSFNSGTVANPGIAARGDLNTGIYFPTLDTIGFVEGGSEAMRIDSSGRVGIGTTGPGARLDVRGNVLVGTGSAVNSMGATNYVSVSTSTIGQFTGIEFYTSDGTYNPRAWIVHTNSANSQSLTFDSTFSTTTGHANFNFLNGNVGIGTVSPSGKLHVQGNVSASSYTSSISNAVGFFGTASFAVSASRASSSAVVDVLSGGSTTGLGIYSGSFSGSFFGALTGTGGGSGVGFPFSGSAVITGSLLVSSSGITLIGTGLTGSVFGTSSWANSASVALTASVVTTNTVSYTAGAGLSGGGTATLGGSSVTIDAVAGAGISLTAPTNDAININTGSTHFTDGVKNKLNTDGVISSSTQFTSLTSPFTGSYTGSLRGTVTSPLTTGVGFIGTSSWASSASVAISSSFAPVGPGTVNSIALFNASTTVSSSNIFQSSNNIGIGLINPGQELSVSGSRIAVDGETLLIGRVFTDNNYIGLKTSYQTSGDFMILSGKIDGNTYLSARSGGNVVVRGGGNSSTAELNITPSVAYFNGNLGVGTSPSTARLQISGSANSYMIDAQSNGFDGSAVLMPGRFFIGTLSTGYPEIGYNFNAFNGVYTKIANDTAWKITFGVGNRMDFANAGTGTGTFSWTTRMSILSASGNVGIGTTAPDVKLSVIGTNGLPASSGTTPNGVVRIKGTTNSAMFLGNDGSSPFGAWLQVQDITGLGTYYPLLLNPNGGNVGIGTTVPITKLHVNDGSARNFMVTSDAAQQGSSGIAIGSFNDNASAYAPLSIVGSVIFFNNNVGIGTINPATKLQVVGDANVSGSLGIFSVSDRNGTGTGGFYRSAGINRLWDSTAGDVIAWNTSANVGIGTTNPGTKLDVIGTSRARTLYAQGVSGDSGNIIIQSGSSNAFWISGKSNAGGVGTLHIGANGGTEPTAGVIVINTSNNVGIGTTNFSAKLQVSGSVVATAYNEPNTLGAVLASDGTNALLYARNGSTSWAPMYIDATTLYLNAQSSGNVGIGTTNPSNRLQIQGNVSASSYTSSINNGVGFLGTASFAVSASRASSSAAVDVLSGGSTTGLGIYSGSFSGSFFGTLTGGGSGAGFPFNGDAVITGSLLITGSAGLRVSGSTTTSGSILPAGDNVFDLGSSARRWANLYTGDLVLSNEGSSGNIVDGTTGNWTVQEGDAHLYIINNKSGKKYKFVLEEIE